MIYTFWHYAIANISFLCAEQKNPTAILQKSFSVTPPRSTYYNEKNRIHSSVITAAASSEAVPPTIPQNYLIRIYQAEKARTPHCPFGCLYSDRL